MKRFSVMVCILIFCFSFNCSAEGGGYEEFYSQQYSAAELERIQEGVPQDTKDFLEQNEINIENPDWVGQITAENVFSHIFNFLKSGAKTPLAAGMGILAVIIISSALSSMEIGSSVVNVSLYATALSVAAIICVPLFSAINQALTLCRVAPFL